MRNAHGSEGNMVHGGFGPFVRACVWPYALARARFVRSRLARAVVAGRLESWSGSRLER